jgi:threonine dehydrogenase-like Zn-dependent dehydrogenase
MQNAWQQLATLPYQQLISHRMPIDEASRAYQILDRQPEDALQILLSYE